MPEGFDFSIKSQSDKARVGELITPHGSIQTPAFILTPRIQVNPHIQCNFTPAFILIMNEWWRSMKNL